MPRLTAGDPATVQALRGGSWDDLAPSPWTIDPDNPMSRWLAVRELRTADASRPGTYGSAHTSVMGRK